MVSENDMFDRFANSFSSVFSFGFILAWNHNGDAVIHNDLCCDTCYRFIGSFRTDVGQKRNIRNRKLFTTVDPICETQ